MRLSNATFFRAVLRGYSYEKDPFHFIEIRQLPKSCTVFCKVYILIKNLIFFGRNQGLHSDPFFMHEVAVSLKTDCFQLKGGQCARKRKQNRFCV